MQRSSSSPFELLPLSDSDVILRSNLDRNKKAMSAYTNIASHVSSQSFPLAAFQLLNYSVTTDLGNRNGSTAGKVSARAVPGFYHN